MAAIIDRYPKATVIECEHYGEVFNRKAQNFRLQKLNPSLILARKDAQRLYPAPADHAIGGENNYYFSHLLNCPFDCRYCFLQGKFDSSHYVLFVNYEDFLQDITELPTAVDQSNTIFSGYDCDSLALEPLTGFAHFFVPALVDRPDIVFELRTKSIQVRQLLRLPATENCIVAFSLAPQAVIDAYEHGTPDLPERIAAIAEIQRATRRFVRHQGSWFGDDDPRIHWFDASEGDPYPAVLHLVRGFLVSEPGDPELGR